MSMSNAASAVSTLPIEIVEPSLFGIDKSQWEIINGLANWLSAFGSIAAACVALYLANKSGKPSAAVRVGHRIIIAGDGSGPPYPEYVVFNIVNTGDRPIRVSQIGWRIGLFRKRYAVQLYDQHQSSRLPIELTHGQEASWFVPLQASEEPWTEYFAKGMLMPDHKTSLLTIRAQVFTSVGHVFEVRPEKNLLDHLEKACQKLATEMKTSP